MPPSPAGSSGPGRRPTPPRAGGPAAAGSAATGPAGASDLDPALRQRLLSELQTPWRGLRRLLWLALTASAGIGLATMALRLAAGSEVAAADLLIQVGALSVCSLLLWFDRNRADAG
ncbi:MAG: DUF3493 domain-containing protein [Synechococcus sp.]|nr:DUF3493 domain-containing protein [Synechococcus sp.]